MSTAELNQQMIDLHKERANLLETRPHDWESRYMAIGVELGEIAVQWQEAVRQEMQHK